jgi:hypothetical protein
MAMGDPVAFSFAMVMITFAVFAIKSPVVLGFCAFYDWYVWVFFCEFLLFFIHFMSPVAIRENLKKQPSYRFFFCKICLVAG